MGLYSPNIIHIRSGILSLIGAILILAVITVHPILAETGKGEDIFKVILTVFGVDKSKGDVVAIVTVNNGEASKVRFLDTDALSVSNLSTSTPSTTSPATGREGGIIDYVITFPNVTVNPGDEYDACVLTTKDLQPICTAGNNSPANRPEFVDLSLDATSEVNRVQQEENGEE